MVSGGQSVTTFPPPILKLSPRREAAIHEPLGQSGWIVAADLDAEIAAEPTHITDDRIAGLHRAKPLEAATSEFLRPIDQLFFFDHLERREPCGASDGTLLVRIMSERRVRRAIEPTREPGSPRAA